ncbi:MAG: ABC transporter permease [Catonella sp.]|jgi:ABC-2 type transport system permease protein|nr:ABC transporter permease [Catonella sp.]
MNHVFAIMMKQFKDSIRNKMIIVVFFMFPVLALAFSYLLPTNELIPILPSFETMNTVMMPIIFMSSIVAEEKEKGSLRMLIMSNVTPTEYLIGIGISVYTLSIISTLLFLPFYNASLKQSIVYLVISSTGILISMTIGAIVALICKNQMSVGPMTAPISMIIGLLPMFATLNPKMKGVAYIFYSYHIREGLMMFQFSNSWKPFAVVLANFIIIAILFALTYRGKGMQDE